MTRNDWQTWWARRQAQLRVDLAAGSLIVALTIAAYLTVIAPARDSRTRAASDAAHLADENSKIDQLAAALTALHAQQQKASQLDAGMLPRFYSASDLNDRLATLGDLASENNVQIDTLEPSGKPTQTTSFSITQINVNGRGSYQNCAAFIAALHEKMRDMSVSSLGVTTLSPGDPAVLSLQLTWYASPTAQQGGR